MMLKMNDRRGYTFLEVMIIVGIISILAVMAIANLKKIQQAISIWAIDTGAASNATFEKSDIMPNYLKSWPKEDTAEYPLPESINATPVCPNSAANTDHTL